MARPLRAAQPSSAAALVPCMSDLKPPSQNSPGAPPARRVWRWSGHSPQFQLREISGNNRPSGCLGRKGFPVRCFAACRHGMQERQQGKCGLTLHPAASATDHARERSLSTAGSGAHAGRREHSADRPRAARGAVARTAVNVAHALLQWGARALIAAEGGPLVNEVTAAGAEWIPLVNVTVNPFKLRQQCARHRAIDRVRAGRHRARAQPRRGVERPHGGGADRGLAGYHPARRASRQPRPRRALHGAAGAGRPDHRAVELCRRAGDETLPHPAGTDHHHPARHRHRPVRSDGGAAGTRRLAAQCVARGGGRPRRPGARPGGAMERPGPAAQNRAPAGRRRGPRRRLRARRRTSQLPEICPLPS